MSKVELQISCPKSWRGITLRQYLDWQSALEQYKEAGDETVTLAVLCGIPPEHITQLPIDVLQSLRNGLSFLTDTQLPLKKIIELGGKEWGFEPNLANMGYGAFIDLTKSGDWNIDEKWPDKMNILYRPVVKKAGALYEIATYGSDYEKPDWMSVTMDIHWGAYFFFINISTALLKDILSSTMETPEVQKVLDSQKNGEAIRVYMKSLTAILQDLKQ